MNSKKFTYISPWILQKIGYIVFFVLYKTFVRLEVKGREHLEGLTSPVIIASNHTHELDVTVLPLALPFLSPLFPLYFVANPKEKYKSFGWRKYIYGGIFFNLLGGYSIHSGHKDYSSSLEDHEALLRLGRTVSIFPEGKRTLDGILNHGRGGLGYLAYATDAPVLPIAINTFFNLSFSDFFLGRRTVVLTILPLMPAKSLFETEKPSVQDFQSASQKVLDRIKEVLD